MSSRKYSVLTLLIHEVAVPPFRYVQIVRYGYIELKEIYDFYLVLIQNQTYVYSISCDNPISWFVPLQFLAVSFVFFEYEDVVFARMSVVVVYAVVSLSASSFACRFSLVSAFKRACRRFLAACSGLSLRRFFGGL